VFSEEVSLETLKDTQYFQFFGFQVSRNVTRGDVRGFPSFHKNHRNMRSKIKSNSKILSKEIVLQGGNLAKINFIIMG
jgi:hypothetical protein